MCPLNLQTGWRQRMGFTPVDTNGCLSFCFYRCSFCLFLNLPCWDYSPPLMRWIIGARAQHGSINTRSTSTFGSVLMLRHKGINKNRSTKVCKLLENLTFYSSELSSEERVLVSLEAADEMIYILQQDVCPLLWFIRESDDRTITVKYILQIGAFSISSVENTLNRPKRHANVGASGSPPQQQALCSLAGRLFWL